MKPDIEQEAARQALAAACEKCASMAPEYMLIYDAHALLKRAAISLATTPTPSDAMTAIATERERQKSVEGWTAQHDDEHFDGQMADAAACYALATTRGPKASVFANLWPWDLTWWKPTDKRRNLVKAGALIVAEIERLDRAQSRNHREGVQS